MFVGALQFVSKAYNSANADVRSAAIKVTREVHDIVGQAIR
jgi:centrosomal protein CEP104